MSYDGERGILTRRIEELEKENRELKQQGMTRSKPYINADHPLYEEPEPITLHALLAQAQSLGMKMELIFRTTKEEEEEEEQADKPKGCL
jgi:hypothetical protein